MSLLIKHLETRKLCAKRQQIDIALFLRRHYPDQVQGFSNSIGLIAQNYSLRPQPPLRNSQTELRTAAILAMNELKANEISLSFLIIWQCQAHSRIIRAQHPPTSFAVTGNTAL